MKGKIALLSTLAVGLIGSVVGISSLKEAKGASAEAKPTIHVMSCNLDNGLSSSTSQVQKGISVMLEADPDIIGTQEQDQNWSAALASKLEGYTQYYEYRGGSIAPYESSGIYFKTDRFHLKGKGTFWFGNSGTEWTNGHVATEWGACFARVCSYVLLNDLETGKDIGFFNAHLEYNHAYGSMNPATESDNTKLCRANSVDQMVRHINALNVPCFLTGDFNFWRSIDTTAFENLTVDLTDAYDYMKDKGGDTGFTFHAYGGSDDDVKTKYPNTPIDYNCCTKGEFTPTTYKIYDDGYEYGKTAKSEYYSDHFYISTVYEYACEYPGSGEQQIDVYNLEAEHGIVNGTSSEQSGEPMIGTRSSSNSRPTSNGTCVMNFATAGNSITWRFNTSKAVEGIKIAVYYAPSSKTAYTLADSYSMSLNGVVIPWETTTTPTIPDYDHWYNWEKLTLSAVTLPKGPVELKLVNKVGCPGNFDNIEIPFNTTMLITDWKDPTVYVDYTIEAEAQMPNEGTPGDPDEGFLVFNTKCSRGACIGNWQEGDTWSKYKINADEAFTGKITVYASNFAGLTNPNGGGGIWVSFNGTQVTFDESNWPSISEGYYTWQELHISNLSFQKGENVFHVENWTGPHNIDKFVISHPQGRTVTYDDKLENFVKDNLHMSDYTESKGWCKDSEHHYYATAKTAYNALSKENKEIFYRSNDFQPAYLRFKAWAAANGDVFNETSFSSFNSFAQILNVNTASSVAVLVASLSAVTIICLILAKKKRKHE